MSTYGFNIDLADTTYTAMLDNTPGDGVPVVAGSSPGALLGSLASVLSGRVDLNPAHIIRECLTNPDWGMGYAEDDVDDAAFTAAADTLFSEGLGISVLWDRQMTLEAFISEMIRHIDAALFVTRSTGKFKLKLTRADYDPDTLITLDESNIDKIESPSRPAFGELVNSVSVKFWNSETGKDDSVTVQDPAGIQMQGAVINTTMQYPGFTNPSVGSRVAARDLRALSNPFLTCTVYTGEIAADLDIGDTFKLSWSKWGLTDVIMRVTGFAMSDGRSSQVRLNCVEDVFATPLNAVIVPPTDGWVDPSRPPDPAASDVAFEVPYYELVQVRGQTDTDTSLAADPDLGFVGGGAMRGSSSAISAMLWTDAGAGYGSAGGMDLCPGGFLTAGIGKKDTEVVLVDHQDLDLVVVGQHCQIGEGDDAELCRVDALDPETGALTIGRGVLDTVPHEHPAGAAVLFWDNEAGADPTEYAAGELVDVKITPLSGAGQVALADATEHTVEVVGRAARPYPPGNLLVNGESYAPGQLVPAGSVSISWVHRDRLLQTSGELADHFDGSIGPEAGTTYRVRGWVDDLLVSTEDDIAGTAATFNPGVSSENLRVEVEAKRDGLYSWQAASHTFSNAVGGDRATEAADARVTEGGDQRVTE